MNKGNKLLEAIKKFFAWLWLNSPLASVEIIDSCSCVNDKHAEGWGAHAIFHVPEERRTRTVQNPDADGHPQRMYMFKVNKPRSLWNPSDDVKEYIENYFQRLDLRVLGITVKKENGDWKYIPFYAEQ